MRVFIHESASLIAERDFEAHPVVVGSSPECGIHLKDSQVADRHLRLIPRDGANWVAEPLEAPLPPLLNGVRLAHPQPLKELDEISIGPFTLKFYFAWRGHDTKTARPVSKKTDLPLPPNAVTRQLTEPLHLTADRLREFAVFTADAAAHCDVRHVIDHIITAALRQFGATLAAVRLTSAGNRDQGRALRATGETVEPPASSSALFESCTHQMQRHCLPHGFNAGASLMAAPIIGPSGAAFGMIFVESAIDANRYDASALDALAAFASAAAPPLERAVRDTNTARAEFANQQIALARGVQELVTPHAIPNWPNLQVAAYRRPGTVNCCDTYDLLRLASGTAALLVARVSAAGPAIARMMAETRSAFRSAGLHNDAPHVFARAVNWLIGESQTGATMDMLCVWLAPESGAIKYCTAGEAVFGGLINETGDWRELESCKQPSIGASPRFAFNAKTAQLEANDTLVLVTPGADLLKNADGKPFGVAGVRECLGDLAGTGASAMIADIAQELEEHARGGAAPDDFTLLLARGIVTK